MFRITVICACLFLVWASPLANKSSKVFFSKLKGPRIINGQKANTGQFPWQAALYVDGEKYSWFCGGTIISDLWILTAGHCVDGAISAIVFTGSLHPVDGTVSLAGGFVLHKDYDEDELANDIGLVRLYFSLNFNSNTAPLRLSSEALDAGTDITVSGWGLTSDDGNEISQNLNFVNLVTITNRECDDSYGEGSTRPEMVCATSYTDAIRSTCSGDSGGPVVVNINSNPVHVAVVSFVSDDGCESGAPSGYTRTAHYRRWISNHTGI